MELPDDYHSGLFLFVAVIVGLFVSAVFRRSAWVCFVWIPTISIMIVVAALIVLRLRWLGSMRGPDAGWGGFEFIFLAPLLGACVSGVIVGFVWRPIDAGWRLSWLFSSLGICLAAFGLLNENDKSTIEIRLTDIHGKPIVGERLGEHGNQTSDASGRILVTRRRHESVGLELVPSFWTFSVAPLEENPDFLKVGYSWQRPAGDETLNEGFIEILPFARHLQIDLTIPPHDSLDPDPRRAKIRAAFDEFRRHPPAGLNHGELCRNLESVELLPELIHDYYLKEGQRASILEGLASIGSILSDVDIGCYKLASQIRSLSRKLDPRTDREILELCHWAEISDIPPTANEALDAVRAKIADLSGPPIDFLLKEMPNNHGGMNEFEQFARSQGQGLGAGTHMNALSEFQQLAHHAIPGLVSRLLNDPPQNMRSALNWSHVFFMLRARQSEVSELLKSDNPLLQAAARDARSDP